MAGGDPSQNYNQQTHGSRAPGFSVRPPPPPPPPMKSGQGQRPTPSSGYNTSGYSQYEQSDSQYTTASRPSYDEQGYSSAGYEGSGGGSSYNRPGMQQRKGAGYDGGYSEDSSYGGGERYDDYGQSKRNVGGRDPYGYDSYGSYDQGYGDRSQEGSWEKASYSAAAPETDIGDVVSEPSWPWQYCEDCDIRFKSEQVHIRSPM